MLTKFLLLEAALIIGMVGAFVHRQLPATEITVGETTLTIKESVAVATTPFTAEPTALAPPTPEPPRPVAPLTSEFVFPVAGYGPEAVISVFGDKRGSSRLHEGIDIKAPKGTPVVAVVDGFVERVKDSGNGGKQVYLRDGQGRLFYYAHLDSWSVSEYDAVRAGEQVGTVGNTGNARATTPHLHFEVLLGKNRDAVDPLPYWVRA